MEKLEFDASSGNNAGEIKRTIQRYLRFWPLFLISILLFLIGAWLYLRYSTPIYLSKSSIYIQGKANSSPGMTGLQDFQNLGLPSGFMNNDVENELSVIRSKPLLNNVVKSLGLEVKTVQEGNVKETELFEKSPVTGSLKELKDPRSFVSRTYTITPLGNNAFKLRNEKHEVSGYYGIPVQMDFGSFVLNRKTEVVFDQPLQLVITNPSLVVDQIEASLNVQIPEKKSSILELSRNGTNPERSEAILNELMHQYNVDAIKDRNAEAVNTAKFVDERLDLITRELGGIESRKENFKQSNRIADLEAQAKLSLQNASDNTKRLLEIGTQLDMVDAVLNAANSSSNDQLLPTNVGMPAGLDQVINEYNQLVLTRNRTLRQATPSNPAVQQFNRDIASMRGLIRDNLRKSRGNLQIAKAQIQNQIDIAAGDISRFPEQERVFRNIEREQNLKEALFLFLLQKREETSLSMAVTTPKAKVVNPAYTLRAPVSPKRNIVYLGALLLGALLPGAYLYTRFTLDTYIHNRRQIREAIPDAVILGEIPNAAKDEDTLIKANDFSSFAEAFRIMFTNMKFMLKKVPKGSAPVILVTSSVKGEGKTTISINTALTLAQNRKVLLIGADIRNPQLKRFMDVKRTGLSDYLADEAAEVKDFIEVSPFTKNLFVLHSGSIPPNPTELLDSPKVESMLTEMRSRYDYIVIDSAPMMMVSDSFSLIDYSDLLLFVMRAEHTDKEMLEFANQLMHDKAKGKLGIVLNAVSNINLSYGNKYGYGYYTEPNKKRNRFLSKLKI